MSDAAQPDTISFPHTCPGCGYRHILTARRRQPARQFAEGFDPSQHPRHPSGTAQGGQFAPAGGGATTPAADGPGYDTGGAETAERIAAAVAGTPGYRAYFDGAHAVAVALGGPKPPGGRAAAVRAALATLQADAAAAYRRAADAAAPEVAALAGKSVEEAKARLGRVADRTAAGLARSVREEFRGGASADLSAHFELGGTAAGLRSRPDLLDTSPLSVIYAYQDACDSLLRREDVRRVLDRHFLGVERPAGHYRAFEAAPPPRGQQEWWLSVQRPLARIRAPSGGEGGA